MQPRECRSERYCRSIIRDLLTTWISTRQRKKYAKPASRLLEAPDEAASADHEVELLKRDFKILWDTFEDDESFLADFPQE